MFNSAVENGQLKQSQSDRTKELTEPMPNCREGGRRKGNGSNSNIWQGSERESESGRGEDEWIIA